MTLNQHLDLFYKKYDIPVEGGVNDKTFDVPLPFFTLKLPNCSWRKQMLYIHDLEHILNEQDTSWKGEMFIASWEIATGFWKSFPIIFFPLWTMGWGFWKHPQAVYDGFRKGYSEIGIANLNFDKEALLALHLSELQTITQTENKSFSLFLFAVKLIGWMIASQIVFLLPLLLFILIVMAYVF